MSKGYVQGTGIPGVGIPEGVLTPCLNMTPEKGG